MINRMKEAMNLFNSGKRPVYRKKDTHDYDIKNKDSAGWISPEYSVSRPVNMDPEFSARNRCMVYADDIPEAESYRILRTQILQRTRVPNSNTIMVTSALPGEGKTVTSINLAFSMAREFRHTVLLLDADIRHQSIHKYLGYEGEKGLVDHLVDGVPVSQLISWPGIEKITLMSGGRFFQESAEILGSPRMKELLLEMKNRYPERYIIIDVPPVLSGADALTLVPLVDHIIVVVEAGKTPLDYIKKAVRFLPEEKFIGFVLNRF
jgi:protein-tyrosine kinase